MKILSDEEFDAVCKRLNLPPDEVWNNGGQAFALGLPIIFGTKEQIDKIIVDPYGKNAWPDDDTPYYKLNE